MAAPQAEANRSKKPVRRRAVASSGAACSDATISFQSSISASCCSTPGAPHWRCRRSRRRVSAVSTRRKAEPRQIDESDGRRRRRSSAPKSGTLRRRPTRANSSRASWTGAARVERRPSRRRGERRETGSRTQCRQRRRRCPPGEAQRAAPLVPLAGGAARRPWALELRRLLAVQEARGCQLTRSGSASLPARRLEATRRGPARAHRHDRVLRGNYQKALGALPRPKRPRRCLRAATSTAREPCVAGDARQNGEPGSVARRAQFYAQAAQQPDQFKNDFRHVSPRLLELLRGSLGCRGGD